MPLKIIRQDITKINCDAIVNSTNTKMIPDGGTDLAIHVAAGKALYECCQKFGGCSVGEAKITPAFKLPCKYVIHTVGPEWGENQNPQQLLETCYKNCLFLALEYGCESIAIPLISSGRFGCPKELALKTATRIISDFLYEHEMLVYVVVYDKSSYEISSKIYSDIVSYIDDNYVDAIKNAYFSRYTFKEHLSKEGARAKKEIPVKNTEKGKSLWELSEKLFPSFAPDDASECCIEEDINLDDMIKNMDKGFAETLFLYIDKKRMTDVECYKRSNVDKKTFSKIKCNKNYRPSKITAVSFAIGLKLTFDEAEHLLSTVGMCLSHSEKFDVIIEYFLKTGNYENIFEVNEVLYKFDQPLLGV